MHKITRGYIMKDMKGSNEQIDVSVVESKEGTPEFFQKELDEVRARLGRYQAEEAEIAKKGSTAPLLEHDIKVEQYRIGMLENKIKIAEKIRVFEKERESLYEKLEKSENKDLEQEIRITEEIISFLKDFMEKEMYVHGFYRSIEKRGVEPEVIKGIEESVEGIKSRMSWSKE